MHNHKLIKCLGFGMMLSELLLLFRVRLYLAVALLMIVASILRPSVKQSFKLRRSRAKKAAMTSHSAAATIKTDLTSRVDEEIEISDEFIELAVFDQESNSAEVEKRNMRKPTYPCSCIATIATYYIM